MLGNWIKIEIETHTIRQRGINRWKKEDGQETRKKKTSVSLNPVLSSFSSDLLGFSLPLPLCRMYIYDTSLRGLVLPCLLHSICIWLCQLKKCTTWELWVKFYLEQNEDCSPGDSISDNSEILLQRGRRGRSIYMWFWWRGSTCNQAHIFAEGLMRVTASHKEQMLPWRNLVLF